MRACRYGKVICPCRVTWTQVFRMSNNVFNDLKRDDNDWYTRMCVLAQLDGAK